MHAPMRSRPSMPIITATGSSGSSADSASTCRPISPDGVPSSVDHRGTTAARAGLRSTRIAWAPAHSASCAPLRAGRPRRHGEPDRAGLRLPRRAARAGRPRHPLQARQLPQFRLRAQRRGQLRRDPVRSRSRAADRFQTFPWVNGIIRRRHDRPVGGGWAWGGVNDVGGYSSEQILCTTHFRIYRAIGGDSTEVPMRQFAARSAVPDPARRRHADAGHQSIERARVRHRADDRGNGKLDQRGRAWRRLLEGGSLGVLRSRDCTSPRARRCRSRPRARRRRSTSTSTTAATGNTSAVRSVPPAAGILENTVSEPAGTRRTAGASDAGHRAYNHAYVRVRNRGPRPRPASLCAAITAARQRAWSGRTTGSR